MISYIIYMVVIDAMVLLTMISLIYKNKVLAKNQRAGLIGSFSLIIILSILDLFTVWIDLYHKEAIASNVIIHNAILALSPAIPTLYANALIGYKDKRSRIALIFYHLYLVFIVIAVPLRGLIYTDGVSYLRGAAFPIFIALYIAFKLYFVIIAYFKVKRFPNTNWVALGLLLISFIAGSSIQLVFPDIHIAWACITIILIVYYAYFNELSRQLDEMTDLFSHQAYIQRSKELRIGETLIIMDCDNFKGLNDTYGHAKGDECLINIASIIKNVFLKHGVSYRIGGDEFAVIVYKDNDVDKLLERFNRELKDLRDYNKLIPSVSIGKASYDGKISIVMLKDMADKDMYKNKLEGRLL